MASVQEKWNPFALAPLRPSFRVEGDSFVFSSEHHMGRVGFWPDLYIRLEKSPRDRVEHLGWADSLWSACPVPRPYRRLKNLEPVSPKDARMAGMARRWVSALPADMRRYWMEESAKRPGRGCPLPEAFGNENAWMHPFRVLTYASRSPSFRQLLASNPTLASEILLLDDFYPRSLHPDRIEWLERTARRPRLELLEMRGFPPRRSVERILRKVQPSARTQRITGLIRELLREGQYTRDLERAPTIGFNLTYYFGGDLFGEEPMVEWLSPGARARFLSSARDGLFGLPLGGLPRLRRMGIRPPAGGFRSTEQMHRCVLNRILGDVSMAEAPSVNREYPEPPFPGCEILNPIRDRETLSWEGALQQVCLAQGESLMTYEEEVLEGKGYFYRAYSPIRATLFLRSSAKSGLGWTVAEAAGRRNEPIPSQLKREWQRILAGKLHPGVLNRWEDPEAAVIEPF